MTPLSERLKRALAFDASQALDRIDLVGMHAEHARTAPVIAELIALIPDIEHAMAFYKSCGDQAEPEYQCHAMFAAALAKLAAAIEGRG